MIRRTPTLIQMSDSDVQDIRDLVAKERAEVNGRQQTLQMKQMADNPNIQKQDLEFMHAMRSRLQDRDSRLGMSSEWVKKLPY